MNHGFTVVTFGKRTTRKKFRYLGDAQRYGERQAKNRINLLGIHITNRDGAILREYNVIDASWRKTVLTRALKDAQGGATKCHQL